MTVQIFRNPDEFRTSHSGSWGLVPTMGALHAGHLTLIARAAAENDTTVVSVFVNPAQFGNASDLSRYPRQLDDDIDRAVAAGASVIYAPEAATIYPPGFATWVEPAELAARWEGKSRPGHFRGVATVVSILLNTVKPDRSYFGEKDWQQLQVIRSMHRDLRLPGTIVASPTVRDMDGLALSSRNARLSPEARITARKMPQALAAILDASRGGTVESSLLESIGLRVLNDPNLRVDYLAVVNEELEPIDRLCGNARILVAAEIDGVRLIDNVALLSTGLQLAGNLAA